MMHCQYKVTNVSTITFNAAPIIIPCWLDLVVANLKLIDPNFSILALVIDKDNEI